MELYFSPLACSLATRIALYEAGADASFIRADTKAKRTADGADFFTINPMGQVPALRTDEGDVLTENSAVLQYVADRFPAAALAPPAGVIGRYRLQQWLSFIGTELHKAVFIPLLDRSSPGGAKDFAHQKAGPRLTYLAKYLDRREYLLDRFSVADAYLVTVLNWAKPSGIELSEWPAIQTYYRRVLKRPSVAKAFAEELALYEAG